MKCLWWWGGGQAAGYDNIYVVQQYILEDKFTLHFILTVTYPVAPTHFPRVVMELKKDKVKLKYINVSKNN
jgi:hypothetical protein